MLDSADGKLRKVGVVSATTPSDETTVHREAKPLDLEVGGLYVGNDDSKMSEIGWGRTWRIPNQRVPAYVYGDGEISTPERT